MIRRIPFFLRKRLSRESCDSLLRKFTIAAVFTAIPPGNGKSAVVQTQPKGLSKKPETNSMTARSKNTLHTPRIITFTYYWTLPNLRSGLYTIAAQMRRFWVRCFTWKCEPMKNKKSAVFTEDFC